MSEYPVYKGGVMVACCTSWAAYAAAQRLINPHLTESTSRAWLVYHGTGG